MRESSTNGIEELEYLGFTQLESEVYTFLLGANASTGYAISQAIAKPAANVYKAITTLENKGAVYVEEGSSRLCTAVSSDELLNALHTTFMNQKNRAERFLKQIETSEPDDKVYRLKNIEQVYEKCRVLLSQANDIVLIDGFLPALQPLLEDIMQVHDRGVKVASHSYEDDVVPATRVFHNPKGKQVREKWKGQWLNLIVDGSNFIMAYFSADLAKVPQAVWSRSDYISGVYYSALQAELQLSELKSTLLKADSLKEVHKLIGGMEQFFSIPQSSGNELMKKFQKK